MRIGMLWFDDNKHRTLEDKVKRAAEHYLQKYQVNPDVCFVHPSTIKGLDRLEFNGIAIKGSNTVLPHHLWIGRSK